MIRYNNHIVARCFWDTSFDNKEKGSELQTLISHWSKHQMPREINSAFNSVCPEKQVLKIKSLELDLGIIAYDNLKEELQFKLKKQLILKLRDILMYPNKHSQSIEVLIDERSHLYALKYFLQQGILPWNYQEIKSSINQIMNHQLIYNKQELMNMIRAIGTKEYVRRRIAWQFKASNVEQIIKNIERSNHLYIIDFSEELIKIQQQETIVKTGIHDFKKNLMFWILNYLFAERGTMFNKIDFVRSNIQQMANHFNIEYYELFTLIEDAVHKAHKHSFIKTSFLVILSILSQKQVNIKHYNFSNERQLEKQWKLLSHYLKSSSNRQTSYQKKRFEELIQNLSKINSNRFEKIITSVNYNSSEWELISNDITESALHIIFYSLSPVNAENVITQIQELNKFEIHKHFNLSKNWLLNKGIHFLKQQQASDSSSSFVNFIITQISSYQKIKKVSVLQTIMHTNLPTEHKNDKSIKLFKYVSQLYSVEITNEFSFFSKTQLTRILKELNTISSLGSNRIYLQNYISIISNWIKKSPKDVWNVLMAFKYEKNIEQFIRMLLNDKTNIKPIIKTVFHKEYLIIKELENSINHCLKKEIAAPHSLQNIKTLLFVESIHVLAFNYSSTLISFIKLLINGINKKNQKTETTSSFLKNIQHVIEYFLQETQTFSTSQKKELNSYISTINNPSKLDLILNYILKYKDKQHEVAEILTQLVYNKETNTPIFKENEKYINSYLLKSRYQVLQEFTQRYLKQKSIVLQKYTSLEITNIIKDVYWQCLVDYTTYKGNITTFKSLFNKSFKTYLKIITGSANEKLASQKICIPQKGFQNNHSEKFEQSISINQLEKKLKLLIKRNASQVNIKDSTFTPYELIFLTLEQAPQIIRKFLNKTLNQKQLINVLKSNISFQQFIALIAKDKQNSTLNQQCESTLALYQLLKKTENNAQLNSIENTFWKHCVLLIVNNDGSTKHLNQLIRFTFEKFSKNEELATVYIVDQIKEHHIKIPLVLKSLLIKKDSIFELLNSQEIKSDFSKGITLFYKNGLLEKLSKSLCFTHKIPSWFVHSNSITPKVLINEILREYPMVILSVLRKNTLTNIQLEKFIHQIKASTFFLALKTLYPTKKTELISIENLYKVTETNTLQRINSKTIQQILLKKVIKSWITSNWKLINLSFIWKELMWEITTKNNITVKTFFNAFDEIKIQLPLSLQTTYNMHKNEHMTQKKNEKTQTTIKIQNNDLLVTGVAVPNAGLVLLNSYFLMLLERLDLVKNNQFISKDTRLDAIHFLQYIATGISTTEESLLALNKVLCGIPLASPIKEGIQISNQDQQLIESLLKSAMGYWSAIGNTSINGFRGNWLVRNGILKEEQDRWNLIVEKRPYDVLMLKSPFSFSIIKLPWMTKPLHVTWPF